VAQLPGGQAFRSQMNALENSQCQSRAVEAYFDALGSQMDRIPGLSQARLVGDDEETKEQLETVK
jgi:tRNA-dihydrouridine synthase B